MKMKNTTKTKRTVITIEYEGYLPKVRLPRGIKAILKFVNTMERDTLVLRRKNIRVFHALKDDIPAYYWMTTTAEAHVDSEDAFDIRDIPGIPDSIVAAYRRNGWTEEQRVLAYAIDQGWINQEGLCLPVEELTHE